MIATVDIADLGAAGTLRAIRHRPKPAEVSGLRWAEVSPVFPLALRRPPPVGRAALLAFWDDEAAATRGRTIHELRGTGDGFHAVLRPLRAYGSWPGLPDDLPAERNVPHDGPVVVFTLGRLRLSQAVRFMRASRPAERSAVDAPGLVWGAASTRPPFVATVSIWESSRWSSTYAFGHQRPQHPNAIAAQQRKDFHRQSAFVRFAPVEMTGALHGRNPIAAGVAARLMAGGTEAGASVAGD